jgi:hypothetical protein
MLRNTVLSCEFALVLHSTNHRKVTTMGKFLILMYDVSCSSIYR